MSISIRVVEVKFQLKNELGNCWISKWFKCEISEQVFNAMSKTSNARWLRNIFHLAVHHPPKPLNIRQFNVFDVWIKLKKIPRSFFHPFASLVNSFYYYYFHQDDSKYYFTPLQISFLSLPLTSSQGPADQSEAARSLHIHFRSDWVIYSVESVRVWSGATPRERPFQEALLTELSASHATAEQSCRQIRLHFLPRAISRVLAIGRRSKLYSCP